MKNAQLTLVPEQSTWRLDPATRKAGRDGLRKARAALAPHLQEADDHELAA